MGRTRHVSRQPGDGDAPYWATAEFKKLERQWYEKLRQEGFCDVESDHKELKRAPEETRQVKYVLGSIAQYYRTAGLYAHNTNFCDPKEQQAMEMHADGLSIRAIADAMGIYRDGIHRILKRHIRKMLTSPTATPVKSTQLNREDFWILQLSTGKRFEKLVSVIEIFEAAIELPAIPKEKKGSGC